MSETTTDEMRVIQTLTGYSVIQDGPWGRAAALVMRDGAIVRRDYGPAPLERGSDHPSLAGGASLTARAEAHTFRSRADAEVALSALR